MNSQTNRRWFTWGRVGALAVSLLILWLIFRRIDLSALVQSFGRLRWGWYAMALAAFGMATVLAACRWHLMLRLTGTSVHFMASYRAVLIGHFFNTLLFGPAGGDLAKSALYGRWYRHPSSEILATSFLDRLLGAGGSVLLGVLTVGLAGLTGALPVLSQTRLPRPGWPVLVGAALVLLGLLIIWRRPLQGESPMVRAMNALAQGGATLAGAPTVAVKGLLLGLWVQVFWCGVLAVSLKAVSPGALPWLALLWTFPVIGVMATAPVTFAGAGVREGAALVLLGLYGVPRADAVAAAMLTLLLYCVWAGVGGCLLWREERLFGRCRARPVAESISVIIPTLNEAVALPETINYLRAIPEVVEIIVADGGSVDPTRKLAEELGCRVVVSPPGRGGQMRRGAAEARGDVVMLVHADTWLPPGSGRAALRSLRDVTLAGGGFWKVFRNPSWLMRGSRWRCALRLHAAGLILGDQALFVRRDVLEKVGGIPDLPLMEEFELCRRLRREGRLALAGATVTTSARRFEKLGPWRTYLRMWRVTLMYRLGTEPHVLRRIYEQE